MNKTHEAPHTATASYSQAMKDCNRGSFTEDLKTPAPYGQAMKDCNRSTFTEDLKK